VVIHEYGGPDEAGNSDGKIFSIEGANAASAAAESGSAGKILLLA
jgi:hypothetical protein